MKKKYTEPSVRIYEIQKVDVIATSTGVQVGEEYSSGDYDGRAPGRVDFDEE